MYPAFTVGMAQATMRIRARRSLLAAAAFENRFFDTGCGRAVRLFNHRLHANCLRRNRSSRAVEKWKTFCFPSLQSRRLFHSLFSW